MSYRKFSANKLNTQIFCKKSTRRSSLEMSRDINFPVMPWGLHVTQFVTSLDVLEASLWKHVWVFLYRSFLSFRRSLSGTMDPNLLRECAQRLLETADFIRNRTAAVTSTTQTTTTTTSSLTTAQPQPNSATVRSEHNRLFGYRPPAPSRAPRNPRANRLGTHCSPYTNAA